MSDGDAKRVAAIDIGTNSVLLTIAETKPEGALRVVNQRATVTRLGQGVDQTGRLHPDAEDRTLACLVDYENDMRAAGVARARAVGTSALRDAVGGGSFLARAKDALGFDVEVISGTREAELTFFGALSGIDLGRGQRPNQAAFVFDIGGGSTELIVGNVQATPAISQCTSLNLGSVRLTERNRPSDPPTTGELEEIRGQVRAALESSGIVVPPTCPVVGVAGTVTTLFAIARQMHEYDAAQVHGQELDAQTIASVYDRLAKMTLMERLEVPGLSKGRADVIVAGAILCSELLAYAGASELIVSDRGVRFGLLQELIASGR